MTIGRNAITSAMQTSCLPAGRWQQGLDPQGGGSRPSEDPGTVAEPQVILAQNKTIHAKKLAVLAVFNSYCFAAIWLHCFAAASFPLPLNTVGMAHTADAASALLSFSGQESDSTPAGKRRQAPTRRPRNAAATSARGKRKDTASVSFVALPSQGNQAKRDALYQQVCSPQCCLI